MSGRIDYEERRQARIDRLNDAAYKAGRESDTTFKRSHDLVKDIPLGQPNIRGALTGVMNKSRNAIDRAIELDEKADYYADRAEAAQNNTAISSDDPEAIDKLKAKIAALEDKKTRIKAFNKVARKNGTEPAPWYELSYANKEIKRLKKRIEKLEQIDQMPDEIIPFDGGDIISDAETNRVIIEFDERQNEEMAGKLKSDGFHWSPTVGGWIRLRNPNALWVAKKICGIPEEVKSW